MVLYYQHVQFYINPKGDNILAVVVTNVHSFCDLVLDILAVLIKDIIVPELFLHFLGQGIHKLTIPEEVNSTFAMFLIVLHAFSNINGLFVKEKLRKIHRIRARTTNSEREEVFSPSSAWRWISASSNILEINI